MLHERKARAVSYDATAKTAEVKVASGGGKSSAADGAALLDGRGELVGVDVDPSSTGRVVVMLGTHEAVARTLPRRLTVTRDAKGEVTSVVVHDLVLPG